MAEMREDNARTPDQIKRMRQLKKRRECFFCNENYLNIGASPSIHTEEWWFVKKNDYPYSGSVHHYLIASQTHVTRVTDLTPEAWMKLQEVIEWLEKVLDVSGASIFVRSGDMRYTGATLDHLHFHFLVGGPKPEDGTLDDNILVTLGHKQK